MSLNKILRRSLIGVVAVSVLSLGSCGRVKPATIQPSGQLVVPDYPTNPDKPFSLTDGDSQLVVNASLLLWDREPSPEQVRDILDYTQAARILRSQALVEVKEKIIEGKKAVALARSHYESFDAQIEDASKNVDHNAVRNYLSPLFASLLEDRLNDLEAKNIITAADKSHAEALWPAYCEAKLWQLAVNTQLSKRYLVRPTPMATCEQYYASKNYFANQELCSSAANAQGKDYFLCIWQEGLLKSELLTNTYKNATCGRTPDRKPSKYKTRLAAITAWLGTDGGVLKEALSPASSVANSVETSIMTGDTIDAKITNFVDCRNAFGRKEPPIFGPEDTAQWAEFKPATLLSIGEASLTSTEVNWRLVLLKDQDASNNAIFQGLTRYIKEIGERPNGGQLAQNTKQQLVETDSGIVAFADGTSINNEARSRTLPSYSDAMFNLPVGELLRPSEDYARDLEHDPLLSGLGKLEPATLSELKAKKSEALSQLNQAEDALALARSNYNQQTKPKIDSNRLSTVDYVKSPGAAVFLNNYYMSVDKRGGQLRVKVGFDLATKLLVGCVKIADGSACPVSSEELGSSGVASVIGFDAKANLITVKFKLDDPTGLGFPDLPKSPTGIQFNAIPVAELKGRTVVIENYSNLLAGTLNVVTGNAYIEDDAGNRLYTGSVTGDNFAQREQALLTDSSN